MSDIASIVLGSSIAAIIGIALGVMLPGPGYGQSHRQRIGSLIAATGIGTVDYAYFVYRLGHDRIVGYLLLGYYFDCAVPKSAA